MKLSQFRYKESADLIAQEPLAERDEARLMVINRKTGKIEHKIFKDLLKYFDDGDVMILNDTKVFPARMYGNKEKTGAQIEVFLLRELDAESKLWDVLVDPARKIRVGNKLYFGEDESLVAEVIDNTTSRGRTIRFLYDGSREEFKKIIDELGHAPLPKYIKRPATDNDMLTYQTIFAKNEGAVSAPSAGLHFSRELLKRLEIKGVNFAHITMHLGLGDFRAIEVEDLTKHKTDSEEVIITEEAAKIVNTGILAKKKICAVDNSVMKAIETSVSTDGLLKPYTGWTNRFIFPPHDFSIANCLVTSFYRPESAPFILTAAFCDLDLLQEAYKEAIKEKYRFLSYGDAMLIL